MTDSADRSPVAAWIGIRVRGLGLGVLGIVLVLGLWTCLSNLSAHGGGVIGRLPAPVSVARALLVYAGNGLWMDLAASLKVFVIGWLAGSAIAAVSGIAIGRVRIVGAMFKPIVEAVRPVSSIAWVPLAIVWFGFGLGSKVFLVGLAVYLVVIIYAIDGAQRLPSDLEQTASMLGMKGMRRFIYLVLPGALTDVLIGARVALMAGWGTVIVAELVAANTGLGAHLISVEQSYDVPAVMATMVCFGLAGFVMNAAFSRLERRLMPWIRVEESKE